AMQGSAYLSTGIGLVILNLEKREVKGTVMFYDNTLTVPVYASATDGQLLYAATSAGVFRTDVGNAFIQNYATWEQLSEAPASAVAITEDVVYAATGDTLLLLDPGVGFRTLAQTGLPIERLDPGEGGVWVSCNPADESAAIAG